MNAQTAIEVPEDQPSPKWKHPDPYHFHTGIGNTCTSEWECSLFTALDVDLGFGDLTSLRRGKKTYPPGNAFPRRTYPGDLAIEAKKDPLARYVLKVYEAMGGTV